MDTTVIDLPDPVASGQIRKLVADAKNLNLSIQSSNLAGLRQLLNTGKCKRFLSSMKNLDSFACSTVELQGSSIPHPPISDFLGDNTWPHLTRLQLCAFHTTASKFSKLLGRHKSTLQELNLQHILLREGTWHDVFVKLRRGSLRVVEVHHLGCGKHLDVFFDGIDELQLDPIPPSHPLHAFLFRGASWMPRMEDVLKGVSPFASDAETDDVDDEYDGY